MRVFNLASQVAIPAYAAAGAAGGTGEVAVSQATPAVVTLNGHGLVTGDTIVFNPAAGSVVAPPAPLVAGTTYYVNKVNANTFNLATSLANLVAGTYVATSGTAVTAASYNATHVILSPFDFLSGELLPALWLPPSVVPLNIFSTTATNASPAVFSLGTGNSIPNGTPVKLGGSASGSGAVNAVPGGFNTNTVYYVVGSSGTTIELAATSGGAALASSSTGGTFYVYEYSTGTAFGNISNSGERYDVTGAPGAPFIEGNSVLLMVSNTSVGPTIAVQGASDSYTPTAGNPGAYSTLSSVSGVALAQPKLIAMPGFMQVVVSIPGSASATTAGVYEADLLGN